MALTRFNPAPAFPRPVALFPWLARLAAAAPLLLLTAPTSLLELSLASGPPIGFAWTLFLVEIAHRLRPTDRSLPGNVMTVGVATVIATGFVLAVLADRRGHEEAFALAIVSTPGWLLSFGLLATALPRLRTLHRVAWASGIYATIALLSQLTAGPVDESRNAERALLFQSALIALAVFLRLIVWWTHEDEPAHHRPS